MEKRIGIDDTGHNQDRDRYKGCVQLNAEQAIDDLRHQGRCHAEGRRCSGKQGDDRQKVNDPSAPAVGVFSEQRSASLRIFLTVFISDVEHEPERHRQNEIERPGD